MSENKDFYKILGVSPQATKDEIKKSYRVLAKKYHPDIYKGDDAEERFKEINEAYNTLYDDNKREQYDQASGFNTNSFDEGFSSPSKSQGPSFKKSSSGKKVEDEFENPFLREEPNPFKSNESSPFKGDNFSNPFTQRASEQTYNNEVFAPKFNPFKDNFIKKEEKVDLHKSYATNPFSDASKINQQIKEENSTFSYNKTNDNSADYVNAQLSKSYETYDSNKFDVTTNFQNINKTLEISKEIKKTCKKIELSALKIHKNLENFIFLVNNGKKTFELKNGIRNFENIVILSTATDFEIIGQPYSRICVTAGGLSAKSNTDQFGSFAQCYGDNQTLIIIPNSILVSKINIGLPSGFRYKNLCFISKRGSLTVYNSERNSDLRFKKVLISNESGITQIKVASSYLSIDSETGNIKAIISHLNENSFLNITSGEGYIDLQPQFQINPTTVASSKGCITNIHENSRYNYFMELDIKSNKGNINIR